MKVICIDGVKHGCVGKLHGIIARKDEEIYEGEIYTVIKTIVFNKQGKSYLLAERPTTTFYDAKRFIPLSNIDEREFKRENISEVVKI